MRRPGMQGHPQTQPQQPQQPVPPMGGVNAGNPALGPEFFTYVRFLQLCLGPAAAGGSGNATPIRPAVHTMLRAFKNQQLSQTEWLDLLRKNPQLMAQVLKLKNEKEKVKAQQLAQQQQQ